MRLSESRGQSSFTDIHVLLVDDNKFFVGVMTRVLTNAVGIGSVTSAYSVATAHAAVRNSSSAINCVICDQIMPEATGLEFLKVIRRGQIKQLRPDIAFIVCTGSDDLRIAEAAEQLDVTAFLRKPPSIDSLQTALELASRCHIRLHPTKYNDIALPTHTRSENPVDCELVIE